MCKYSNVFSLAVLIGRGLDHSSWSRPYRFFAILNLYSVFSAQAYAPLAQLVEHLTLNQGVRGSNPR